MFMYAIPVLHVSTVAAAEAFYCRGLGFRRTSACRADESKSDPCYMGLIGDGVKLHVSSFPGDGVAGGVVFLVVDDTMRYTRNSRRKACRSTSNRPTNPGAIARCTSRTRTGIACGLCMEGGAVELQQA